MTLHLIFLLVFSGLGQTITSDVQGHTNGQSLANPCRIVNNSETFWFTLFGGATTNHFYRTAEGSCGGGGLSHIYSRRIAQTTWPIEPASGNEVDLGSMRFDNVFACFVFNFDLSVKDFKNNVSTETQTFSVTGINSIFTSNSNFNDVEKIIISSSNLGNLGINNINWVAVITAVVAPKVSTTATSSITSTPATLVHKKLKDQVHGLHGQVFKIS
ncbi:hypothetical protein [Polaribacter glomeratus]|uniref:hypothetical protein n=1 Tax=Polaribacter glomeratus TaxID=102 RepID=UPI0011B0069C|nr:hypothetical protein [Polaribacter glomeratus]TXD64452.1 hypothetical protein ESX12_15130 [Polaribacter glomeratus]